MQRADRLRGRGLDRIGDAERSDYRSIHREVDDRLAFRSLPIGASCERGDVDAGSDDKSCILE